MQIIKLDGKNVDEEYYKFIDDEFNKYAEKNNITCNYMPFFYIVQDGEKLVGAITGYSYYEEVRINDLVVIEEYRKKHIGSMLVNRVIEDYRGREFKNVNLSTYGFQALDFYKKLGFEVEFVRENDNKKLNKYYLIKKY